LTLSARDLSLFVGGFRMRGGMNAMLWSLDLDTYCYLSVSDAGVELLGYSREELLR
jgi:hypothetical protein